MNMLKTIGEHLKKWWKQRVYRFRISYLISFIHRGKYGWSKRDVWDFYVYLSKIIVGGLKELKETTSGYPVGLDKTEIGSDKKAIISFNDENIGFQRWQKILDDIIEGFEYVAKDVNLFPTEEGDDIEKIVNEHIKTMNNWFEKDKFNEVKERKEIEYQIKAYTKFVYAMKLFQKHFLSFWD